MFIFFLNSRQGIFLKKTLPNSCVVVFMGEISLMTIFLPFCVLGKNKNRYIGSVNSRKDKPAV